MQFNLSTPALLFPAISLLLLAFTNRYLALSALIRQLGKELEDDSTKANKLWPQVRSLMKRLELIRLMQICGVASLLFCTASMGALFLNSMDWGRNLFLIALFLMMSSLLFSVIELQLSLAALKLNLQKIDESRSHES